jgi:hypothetical protein
MVVRRKLASASWVLAAAMILLTLPGGCRRRGQLDKVDDNVETAGEPAHYSATVICTFEDGTRSETTISREARSGEQRRQEWNERGQNRALIWRPDLGKSFLLDLDRRTYIEMDIGADRLSASRVGVGNSRDQSSALNPDGLAEDVSVQAIDNDVDDAPPTRVETGVLPDALIQGHSCAVYEERAIFPDGHVETTKKYRARDLSGLVLKVESGAEHGTAKLTIERRDIRNEVPLDTFIVPSDFRKVQNLPR